MANILRKCFSSFGGLGLKPKPFLVYQPAAINQTNHNLFVVCYSFEDTHGVNQKLVNIW